MKQATLIALILCLIPGFIWAAGARESGPVASPEEAHEKHEAHDHDAHEHHDDLPHIEPVSLGAGEKLRVVATTNIVGDVLRNVAGDAIGLTVLMEPGQNPHGYEPAPSAFRAIERAHIVFVNGFDLEENLMNAVRNTSTGYIVPASAGIAPIMDDDDDHVHQAGDPHVWTDPNNVIIWTRNMAEALGEADPRNTATYEANAEAYVARLEEIDRSIRERIADLPQHRRKLVADHDAVRYFALRYGFEVVGAIVPGTTDTAQPSARDIARLVELIRTEDVQVIFVGRTASRGLNQLAATIASEVGSDVRILPLLTGSLAPQGEPGDTYLGFLQFNVEQILTGVRG